MLRPVMTIPRTSFRSFHLLAARASPMAERSPPEDLLHQHQQQQQPAKPATATNLEAAKANLGPGIARMGTFIMKSAQGCTVTATDGRKYLDFSSGIGVTSTGHCHPKVTAAVAQQAANLVHCQLGVAYHEPMLKLINRLLPIVPKGLDSFYFCNSGAEAVEASVKVARNATKRNNIIVFQGSFHGRTYGAMALTTSKSGYSAGLGVPMPSVFVAPYPYASQLPKGLTETQISDYCIEHLERMLKQQTHPSDTAAVLIEPILGEGGYIAPPKDFLPRLKKICEKHNILFIADEVQSGFGRTGKMFAVEHSGVTPDIMVIAKGLASGYPLSGIVARSDLTKNMIPGGMGGTYAGNAVSCAAALATLEVFEEEKLVENAVVRGKQLKEGLLKLAKKYPVKEVRGYGLMVAMEFDESVPAGTSNKITQKLLDHGMILFNCSVFETIRYIPALTVSPTEIDLAIQKTDDVLKEVFASK